ncbi:MAG TPA: HAD family acid phosphatase [Xanthomonadales bacterium]|nr:HAD family acid phosphatase [Xanthomonadales bacterium]
MRKTIVVLSVLALAACASTQPRGVELAPAPAQAAAGHDNLNAVAWMQTASEWQALSRQAFTAASRQLAAAVEHLELLESMNPDPKASPNALISNTYEAAARNQRQWNALVPSERVADDAREPLAVIVDVDETVLDNSPYQARQVRDGLPGFDETSWSAWVQERKARPLPGALEFARRAADDGVTVFYVTNRDARDREATIDNLRAAGFPLPDDGSTVMVIDESRGWTGDKAIRRREVDRTHRVVLLIGDNLGDFLGGASADNAARAALVEPYQSWWGERWFMLPNPAYGSWEGAATRYCKDPALAQDPRGCKLTQLRYD